MYLCGVDLGDKLDFTAVVVVEQFLEPPAAPRYEVCHLERLPLGSGYPAVLAHLRTLFTPPPWSTRDGLLVDVTGVGLPVFQLIEAGGFAPVGIFSHRGASVTQDGQVWHVPKRDLISAAEVAFQTERVLFDPRLPFVPEMVHELESYRRTQDTMTGHESYAAWREKDHDDLLFSLAMVCWWGAKLAAERVPDVNLSLGLVGTQMPRRWRDPMATARPRLGRLRVFNDTMPDAPPFDEAGWEAAKRAVGDGLPVPRSPQAP